MPHAFMTAHDKKGVAPLGLALAEAGFEIVSLGNTRDVLLSTGLTVTPVDEFIPGKEVPRKLTFADERERREFFAERIGQRLALPRPTLLASGRTPLDFAYINLQPPGYKAKVGSTNDGAPTMHTDKSGMDMILAAVEGRRAILTRPRDMDDFTARFARPDYNLAEDQSYLRDLSKAAMGYTSLYLAEAARMTLG